MKKAKMLSGYSIHEIAEQKKIFIPSVIKDKGWVGKFLERCLGSTSKNKCQPDFEDIHVELKTISINKFGYPLQSIFICMVPLNKIEFFWKKSCIWNKIKRILWIPIQGNFEIPLLKRKIGTPFFWSPSFQEEKELKKDWEIFTEIIFLGKAKKITSKYGTVLQISAKFANKKTVTKTVGKRGELIKIVPLAFYFKKNFIAKILKKYFLVYF